MAKALIVFGSETGNTKAGADLIAKVLEDQGVTVEIQDVREVNADVLSRPYDLAILGVSTWGAIDEEVQQDFESFYDGMAEIDLHGRRLAVFGSGDQGYDKFAKAVDFVEQRARKQGAEVVTTSLKYHLHPKDSAERVKAWAEKLAAKIQ